LTAPLSPNAPILPSSRSAIIVATWSSMSTTYLVRLNRDPDPGVKARQAHHRNLIESETAQILDARPRFSGRAPDASGRRHPDRGSAPTLLTTMTPLAGCMTGQ
jgi:hypothetical protein